MRKGEYIKCLKPPGCESESVSRTCSTVVGVCGCESCGISSETSPGPGPISAQTSRCVCSVY